MPCQGTANRFPETPRIGSAEPWPPTRLASSRGRARLRVVMGEVVIVSLATATPRLKLGARKGAAKGLKEGVPTATRRGSDTTTRIRRSKPHGRWGLARFNKTLCEPCFLHTPEQVWLPSRRAFTWSSSRVMLPLFGGRAIKQKIDIYQKENFYILSKRKLICIKNKISLTKSCACHCKPPWQRCTM